MVVKIFTEGGSNIGLGHISRCCCLYDEITGRGIMVEFIIFGDIEGLGLLRGKNVININWISSDYLNCHINNTDYCIVDSYLATKEINLVISDKSKKALFIDDNMGIEYPKGIIVKPSLCNEEMFKKDSGHIYLVGVEYILLRSAFVDVKRGACKRSVEEVLITMGGSDIRNLTPKIIDMLCMKHSEIKFKVVVGNAYYNIDQHIKKERDNVVFYYNIDAELMKELMLNSEFAIAAAGQTLYELLATKTPFIAIKVIDNQKVNVDGIKKHFPSISIFDCEDEDFIGKFEAEFETMLKQACEEDLSKRYMNIVDGKGSKRIIDALLSLDYE
jgi:spore coat polysaccharide biosynthesis predicted glycosyltransferase SpsG